MCAGVVVNGVDTNHKGGGYYASHYDRYGPRTGTSDAAT